MDIIQLNNKYLWQYYFICLFDFNKNFIKFQNGNIAVSSIYSINLKSEIKYTLLTLINLVDSKSFSVVLLVIKREELGVLNSFEIFQKINIKIKPVKNKDTGIINLAYFI